MATPAERRPAPLVLVVDDVDHGREIFAEYLEFRGFRVATAADGLEALDKAFELLPDVILMDLSLPGIDGWEATRRLKRDDAHARHPDHRAHRPRPGRRPRQGPRGGLRRRGDQAVPAQGAGGGGPAPARRDERPGTEPPGG